MFDSREQITDQLRAGEDGYAEFKEVRFGARGVISPNTEDMAGELVALANAAGGVVFLGIDDSGTVQGIPRRVSMQSNSGLSISQRTTATRRFGRSCARYCFQI